MKIKVYKALACAEISQKASDRLHWLQLLNSWGQVYMLWTVWSTIQGVMGWVVSDWPSAQGKDH